MSNTLLNLADKTARDTKTILIVFYEVATKLGIDYMVVGATARDLVMVHGYGVQIDRATYDVDFAIQVKSWEEYQLVKNKLLEKGFSETKDIYRLNYEGGSYIDLVPYGGIEHKANKVALPPKGDRVLNTIGFREARASAILVNISDQEKIVMPVLSAEGFTLLKFIAWTDRDDNLKQKDKLDIEYMLAAYHEIAEVNNLYYERMELIKTFGGDIHLGGAYLLGEAVRQMCELETEVFLREQLEKRNNGFFVHPEDYMKGEKASKTDLLFHAFQNGFERRLSKIVVI